MAKIKPTDLATALAQLAEVTKERDLQKGRIFRMEREIEEILEIKDRTDEERELIQKLAQTAARNKELESTLALLSLLHQRDEDFAKGVGSGQPVDMYYWSAAWNKVKALNPKETK